jgi:DedD protein
MEIDDNLKNRLAGVAVVTVLAVIFLPMLFDDPVEKKAQVVSEQLDIPPSKPEVSPLLTTKIVPDKATEVTNKPKPAAASPEIKASEQLASKAELSNDELNAETNSLTPEEEAENEAPPPKKLHKKEVVVEQNDEAVKAEKPWQPKEKKPAKKTKAKLPTLDIEHIDQDKKKEATANRRWMIQVASVSDENKAIAFRDKLRSQGFPATINEATVNGKRVYRLKVGPELDADKAQSMKSKINQLNNVNSIAIPE